jgi:hypothetical protein
VREDTPDQGAFRSAARDDGAIAGHKRSERSIAPIQAQTGLALAVIRAMALEAVL